MNPALLLTIDALAAHRITRLVTTDMIFDRQRNAVERWAEEGRHPKILALIECPHCVSVYAGFGIVAAGIVAPKAWRPVARALALSAVVSLVADYADA